MERVKNILVATDHSEDACRAETRAAMLSVELKAETLELMTVQNTRMGLGTAATFSKAVGVREDDAIALLENRKTLPTLLRQTDGPTCIRSIRAGGPEEAIVKRANEMCAELIVVAARGKRFFINLFPGHRNDALIRMTERPLLLVNAEPMTAYRSVLVAVDFSAASRAAASMALALAPAAHFTFLHAFRVPDEDMMLQTGVSLDLIHGYRMRAREAARVKLNQFIDDLGPRRQLISRAIHHGQPAAAIKAQARQMKAELIAIGKHGGSRFIEFLLGSVAQRLADQSLCDLLVTAPPDTDSFDYPPAA